MSGVWRVHFSLESRVEAGEGNFVYIYHNQQQIEETQHESYSEYDLVQSTGGRELIMRAEQGDTFSLDTEKLDNGYYGIITCFEFVSL